MSEFDGDNKALGESEPTQLVDSRDQHGRIRTMKDSYTLLAELAATDKIFFGRKLPEGAQILDAVLDSPNNPGLTDMDLGWEDNGEDAADQDGLLDGISIAVAKREKMSDTQGRPGQYKRFAAETQISLLANAGPSTAGIGTTISVEIKYVTD